VSQFWQYPQWKSHPSIPNVRVSETWQGVKERLLLGGIALQRRDVAGGDVERAIPVEADLADPPAGRFTRQRCPQAKQRTAWIGKLLDQLPLTDPCVQGLSERRRSTVRGRLRVSGTR